MIRRTLILFFFGLAVIHWQGCTDTSVEPGPYEYPIDLVIDGSSSSVSLSWTKATVSTFAEYIIVRSTDSIPDTAEPDLIAPQVIVERIDQVDVTTFEDFSPPISEVLYYKVFVKIGERFLISQTARVDLTFQIIDYRTDVARADIEKHELIGYDRVFDVLFRYDYEASDIVAQHSYNWNNPLIKLGEYMGAEEVYVSDRNFQLHVLDREDFQTKDIHTSSSGRITDFVYNNGQFVIALDNGQIELRNHNLQLLDVLNSNTGQKVLHLGPVNGGQFEVIEIGINYVKRHKVAGNDISQLGSRNNIVGGSGLISSISTSGTSIVANNAGKVITNTLVDLALLGNGQQFFNLGTYSGDDEWFVTFGFEVNDFVLRYYDAQDGYKKFSTNQVSTFPQHIWADSEKAYTATIVSINGGVKSVLANYDLP